MILLASCASKSGGDPDGSANAGFKPMSERLNQTGGYKQDSQGNWAPQTNQRSTFDGKGAAGGTQGNVGKKTYQTGGLAQKSWWGNKNYGQKKYSGNTANTGLKKTSALGRKGAREGGNASSLTGNYGTGRLASRSAREGASATMANRRSSSESKRHEQPVIVDWKQQRSLSVEQSNGILGR